MRQKRWIFIFIFKFITAVVVHEKSITNEDGKKRREFRKIIYLIDYLEHWMMIKAKRYQVKRKEIPESGKKTEKRQNNKIRNKTTFFNFMQSHLNCVRNVLRSSSSSYNNDAHTWFQLFMSNALCHTATKNRDLYIFIFKLFWLLLFKAKANFESDYFFCFSAF